MTEQQQYYKVSRIWFSNDGGLRDPHVPDNPQFHHAIFVQTEEDSGNGYIHNVNGDVTTHNGMSYEKRFQPGPISSQCETFRREQVLGYIPASSSAYLEQFEAVLRSCPTPPRQKAFNVERNATEPFKTVYPSLTFYTADEVRNFRFPRLRKCKWWVEEQAIPALERSQLLVVQSVQSPTDNMREGF